MRAPAARVLPLGCLLWTLAASPGSAQDLEGRVRAVSGDASFAFAIREDVRVCDDRISWDGERDMHWGRWSDDEPRRCSEGLARAVLEVRNGRVRGVSLEPFMGPGESLGGATDLGRIPVGEATDFLLTLAREHRDGDRTSSSALMATVIADSVEVWPRLLDMARDRSVDGDVRESALFWVGQVAADAATEGLAQVARDEDEEQDVRDAAIFALSQRPEAEYVPILMELARTAEQAKTRRTAMFWLAQSDDPSVPTFFEEILLGRSGGG